jgi:hypothetical protein
LSKSSSRRAFWRMISRSYRIFSVKKNARTCNGMQNNLESPLLALSSSCWRTGCSCSIWSHERQSTHKKNTNTCVCVCVCVCTCLHDVHTKLHKNCSTLTHRPRTKSWGHHCVTRWEGLRCDKIWRRLAYCTWDALAWEREKVQDQHCTNILLGIHAFYGILWPT